MKTQILIAATVLLASPLHVAIPGAQAQIGSSCAPQPGRGAQWLAPCQKGAEAGDGRAALMVGIIYWNGDGVPKSNSTAAHWFQLADKAGEPRAAKLLGDEAFVRLTAVARPEDADRTTLDEAIAWYQKALRVEPFADAKTQAQQRLELLARFKQQLPAR